MIVPHFADEEESVSEPEGGSGVVLDESAFVANSQNGDEANVDME